MSAMGVSKQGKIIRLLCSSGPHFPWERYCFYGSRLRDLCPLCLARLILWCLYALVRDFIKKENIWDPTIWAGGVVYEERPRRGQRANHPPQECGDCSLLH